MRLAPLLLLAAIALPAFASDDFTSAVKEALASAEPTTAVLRALAKLPDFELEGAKVEEALAAAGAKPDGEVAKVLGSVTRITKKGDRVTIERTTTPLIPIVVKGVKKGYVQPGKTVAFRLRRDGDAVWLDEFSGIKLGKKEDDLYALKELAWAPGTPISKLTVVAGWGVFTETNVIDIETPGPPPPPKETAGILGRMR